MSKPLILCQRTLCVLGETSKFGSVPLPPCAELQCWTQVRDKCLCGSFLSMCRAFHICIASKIIQNMSELFKACSDTVFLSFSFYVFLANCLLFLTGITALDSFKVKQVLLIMFNQHSEHKAFLTR